MKSESPPLGSKISRSWVPFFVLAVSLLLTFAASYYAATTTRARDWLRFQTQVQRTQVSIEHRMQTYIALLRATNGLFAANGTVSREQFRAFVLPMELRRQYPGIQGIGFTLRVLSEDKQAVEAAVRAEGNPTFRIWPEHQRPEYHTILYLEPLDRRNRAAIGYDMYTEPVRRAAMRRARDTGLPAASGRVTLVQEIDEAKQAGFLIYLPVYRRGARLATVADRRAALEGFVYSPFRADDLLAGIFGTGWSPTIAFEVFAGPEPSPASLLHRSEVMPQGYEPSFTAWRRLDVAHFPWTISYATLPAFDATSSRGQAALLLLLGLLGSGVLFVVARAEVRARSAADRLYAAERQARAEAESANQAKDRFMAALSHELRTPLTPVLAVLSKLEPDGRLPADVRDSLAMVRRNVDLEARLIDDLLDLTRITQGKLELRQHTADLYQILEHAIETCTAKLPAGRRPRIDADIAPADYRLWADAPRLTQVFWNLLNNALKFTPADGTVRVRMDRDGGELVAEVSDTGIGIEPERLPYVFDAFVQAERSITRQFGGLGLGLAISRSIVELHGGTLAAASAGRGKGATFTVRLPVGDVLDQTLSLPTPTVRTRPESEASQPLHILLVEDHADTATAMADLLRDTGRRVTVAGSVASALDAAAAAARNSRRNGIDLVISDLGLPDGSGLELMQELSRRYGLKGIALSGFGMDDDIRKSQEAGFAQHLTKPVTLQVLESAIAQVSEVKR